MINSTLRHDTLRQWPVERLPSFEDDDEDDAVETVRMPDRGWHEPEPSSNPSTHPNASTIASPSKTAHAAPASRGAGFRQYLENTDRWLSRISASFSRHETTHSRWVTAVLATALFAVLEILDAHSGSRSVAAHVVPKAVPVPQVPHVTNAAPPPTTANVALNAQSVESLPLVKSQPTEGHTSARHTTGGWVHSRAFVEPGGPRTPLLAKRPFDALAARNALDVAASNTRRCTRNQMAGTVVVSFSPSGEVSDVTLGTLAGDVIQTHCVVQAFRNVRVAPFAGRTVRIRKTFAVSQ